MIIDEQPSIKYDIRASAGLDVIQKLYTFGRSDCSFFFDELGMKLQHLSLFAILVLLEDILGLHPGDHAATLLLSPPDHDCNSTDLDASGDN